MQTAARASIQSPGICCALTLVRALAFSTSPSLAAARRGNRTRRPGLSKYQAQHDRLDPHREHSLDDPPHQAAGRAHRFERRERYDHLESESELRPARVRYTNIRDQSLRGRKQKKGEQGHPIHHALDRLGRRLLHDTALSELVQDNEALERHYNEFRSRIETLMRIGDTGDALLKQLNLASRSNKPGTLDNVLRLRFFRALADATTDRKDVAHQQQVANMAYPSEWFPATRGMQREFHLHVGPTNSGKTYHALKRLEEADTGIYAGPLRLLAHEVYLRLNARGRRCNLITGDDRRTADNDDPNAPMVSCTVEMVPLNWKMDVAVIDEIQMLGSEDRGWAWTQAVFGVQAREVHVCGEERAVPIMRELAALCGDKLKIHRYERLSPLRMMSQSLHGDVSKLKKGDCVVCFSVVLIHALRQLIERTLECKVAVVYGSLPPETRAKQAQLFNDPENDYDILVASDAVGMGLNLSIKRMIFHASSKLQGSQRVLLQRHEIKQIAGRAGRFSTTQADLAKSARPVELDDELPKPPPQPAAQQEGGLVTTLDPFDYPRIALGLTAANKPIKTAGIFPPAYIIERFAMLFPRGTPFSFLLLRLSEIAKMTPRFHICDVKQHIAIADAIEPAKALRINDRLTFCSSPCDPRKKGELDLVYAFAELVAERRGVTILDVPELDLDLLEDDYPITRDYLRQIEGLHKGVVLWMWLSYRFEAVFLNRELAIHVKELVENRIADVLAKLSFDYERLTRQQALLQEVNREESGLKVPDRDERGVGPSDELIPDDVDDELIEGDDEAEERQSTGELFQYDADQAARTGTASAESVP